MHARMDGWKHDRHNAMAIAAWPLASGAKNTKNSSLYSQSLLIFTPRTLVVKRHLITREIRDLLFHHNCTLRSQNILIKHFSISPSLSSFPPPFFLGTLSKFPFLFFLLFSFLYFFLFYSITPFLFPQFVIYICIRV